VSERADHPLITEAKSLRAWATALQIEALRLREESQQLHLDAEVRRTGNGGRSSQSSSDGDGRRG
jgi:hypothetical protein